tara:strand:+ start:1018 stop:1623 length:606 start_codon:yes stop_codon:yes gene_type:complete
MDKVLLLFDEEVKKQVAVEVKKIREELKENFKKVKEEYRESILSNKQDVKEAVRKVNEEYKEGLQKQRALHNDELRRLKDEHKNEIKQIRDEFVVAQNTNQEMIKKLHISYSDYLRVISMNYPHVPYKLLLRDAPNEEDNTCRGLKKNGTRCNLVGKYDGYCKHHHDQYRKRDTVEMIDDSSSVLSFGSESKGLIDFNSML